MDIFARAGRGIAHDEYVPFTVKGGHLIAGNHKSLMPSDRQLKIEFFKVLYHTFDRFIDHTFHRFVSLECSNLDCE